MKKGWETKKLGEVCSFLNRGVSPKYVEKGGIVVLNQRCVRGHRVNYEVARRHDIKAKSVNPERFVQAGDVLVNSTGEGTLGRVAQLREAPAEPTTVDSHVTIVRPAPGVFFTEFFGYVLRDIEEELQASGEGCGGQTELNRSVLAEKFIVRFPTALSEQQRIVGVLDEAFAGLATAQAHAAQNLQNARALFQVHLDQFFDSDAGNWKHVTFGDVVVQSRGGISIKSSEYSESGIPVITKGDIKPLGKIEHGGKYVGEALVKRQRWPLAEPGDLIVATRDLKFSAPFLGLVSRVPSDRPYVVNQGATYFKVDESRVVPDYFVYWCCCTRYREHVVAKKSGATQVHIREADLFSAPLSLPSIKDQHQIIDQLDALAAETQRLTRLYEQKQAALAVLKKSLLHQAFTGEL